MILEYFSLGKGPFYYLYFDSKLDCQFVTGHSTHFQVGGDNPKVEEQEFF
jgi:hypothetical protein